MITLTLWGAVTGVEAGTLSPLKTISKKEMILKLVSLGFTYNKVKWILDNVLI